MINRAKAKRYRVGAMKRARELHQKLIAELGGRCARCEEDGTNEPLSIDHVGGSRKWNLQKLRYDQRVKRYAAEHAAGVELRVLCRTCNSCDRQERYAAAALPPAPF